MTTTDTPHGLKLELVKDLPTVEELRGKIIMETVSNIEAEIVECVWEDFIPTDSFSLMFGDPGNGKSTLAYGLAALLSRGHLEGRFLGKPVHTIVLAPEDGLATVVRPRLEVNNADMDIVHIAKYRQVGNEESDLIFPRDLLLLADILQQTRSEGAEVGLIIIDSLSAVLPADARTNDYGSMGAPLRKINKWAEENEVAVLGIWHPKKDKSSGNLLEHISGSVGIGAAVRAAIYVKKDEEASTETEVHGTAALVKSNALSTNRAGQKFSLTQAPYTGQKKKLDGSKEATPSTSLKVNLVGRTAGAGYLYIRATMERAEGKKKKRTELADWLENYLLQYKNGRSWSEIKAAVLDAGLAKSNNPIVNALTAIGAHKEMITTPRPEGQKGPPINVVRYWLPDAEDQPDTEDEAGSENQADMTM